MTIKKPLTYALLLSLVLMAGTARAATLFTPPLFPDGDSQIDCYLLNVSDEVRRDALAAASVYAQPSRTDSFGIAYLEAWCYGAPVVGARAGGVPAVIDDGENGLLVPFGDVGALAGALERLLRDGALARRLGASGRAKVLRELTWDAAYGRARAFYRDLAGSPGAPN